MTDKPLIDANGNPLGRRGLIRSGAIGGAAALLAASTGTARATALAPPPVNDTDYPDFSLIKINSDDDSLAKIQKKGLVVGTSNDWPYSFLDPKTNEWTGLDADFINYACKVLKIEKVTVQTVTFDGLIPGLLDGRFDIVGDSIHYTKNRSKVVNFSFPNYYYAEGLVVPAGNPHKLHQLADLKGYTVGTLLGTNYAEWLQAVPGVKFQGYKDWAQIIPELAIGRTDAALYDQPVVAALMKQHPEWKIELVEDYEPRTFKNPTGYSRYAFRQGDIQWVSAVSSVFEWMEYNDKAKGILSKWGLTGYNN
ncbi:MAG TPA: ABC transporter substrate-binding protein [Acetobacteraceae bacterium]|jgi:polar amino acid transport system substrate-binding protein|nr:ABC transporter substrate-binding protein [Acetobacteraceae bacterium]